MSLYKSQVTARLAGAALLGLFSVGLARPAMAADLGGSIKDEPVYAEPPRMFSWTGFYVGANLGGAWTRDDARYSRVTGAGAFSTDLNSSSVVGGGQLGYNWQAGSFVVGLEADIQAQRLDGHKTVFPFTGNAVDAVTLGQDSKWFGTVRPRVGYAADRVLIYVTGGLAYGKVEHSLLESHTSVAGQNRSFTDSSTRAGWVVGSGIEWAVLDKWTLGAEYLHVDLGSTTISTAAATVGGFAFPASTARFEDREDIVRAKLNYKF